MSTPKHPGPPAWLITGGSLVGLGAGLAAGVAANRGAAPALLALLPTMEVIGTLWTNALLMVILPLVVSLLIGAVASLGRHRQAGRLGAATLGIYLAILVAAMAGVLLVVPLLLSGYAVDPATLAALREGSTAADTATQPLDARAWLLGLIPANPVRAAADGELLPVVVSAVIFGLAIARVGEKHREVLTRFFAAVAETCMVVVRWILMVIPLAVFALAFTETARVGTALVGMVGIFLVLISGLLVLETLAFYPLATIVGKVPLRRFAAAALPAQAVAAGTRSSLATLPTLLESAKSRLGLPAHVADFVLPFSISSFKPNRAVSSMGKLLFLTHVYQVPMGPEFVLLFAGMLILLSFSSPGIPSGGFLTTLPFYLAAGIPVEAVVLLRAVDAIPDVFKTVVNVTGDLAIAVLAHRVVGDAAPGVGVTPGVAA